MGLAPALLQGFRLREGPSWWWINLILQLMAGLLVPALMWWFGQSIETDTFLPFVILAVGHIAGIEAASYLSPRLD